MSGVEGFAVTSTVIVMIDGKGYRIEEILNVLDGEKHTIVYAMLPSGLWILLLEKEIPDALHVAIAELANRGSAPTMPAN